jgi:hypothetical protein
MKDTRYVANMKNEKISSSSTLDRLRGSVDYNRKTKIIKLPERSVAKYLILRFADRPRQAAEVSSLLGPVSKEVALVVRYP